VVTILIGIIIINVIVCVVLAGILEQWTGKCEESLSDIQAQLLDAQQKKSAHMKLKNQTDTEVR